MAGESPFSEETKVARPATPRGFSLAALFLLVTTAGVVSALARGAWDTETEGDVLSIHATVGFVLGGGLGLWTGLYYPRRLPASMIGMAVGAVTGGICAAVAAAGTNGWLFVGGSAGIIALGLLARRRHTTE
jgi:peptidoglycan/LPS O-acetylase OafA/YrhL